MDADKADGKGMRNMVFTDGIGLKDAAADTLATDITPLALFRPQMDESGPADISEVLPAM